LTLLNYKNRQELFENQGLNVASRVYSNLIAPSATSFPYIVICLKILPVDLCDDTTLRS